jgi:hypothetical protein
VDYDAAARTLYPRSAFWDEDHDEEEGEEFPEDEVGELEIENSGVGQHEENFGEDPFRA